MSQPAQIYYCHACGRVATEARGPESLLGQGCEGTQQRYVRSDLVDRLLGAIFEHGVDVERKVSKDRWSRANRQLQNMRIEIEKKLVTP